MKVKFILSIICVLLIVFIGFYFFLHSSNPYKGLTNYPLKGTTIVAFGDSLTAGYGSTKGHDYVTVLSQKLAMPIINKGKAGDTSAAALKRIGVVDALHPNVVIVYLGGNDVLQQVPIGTTFTNIEKIVSHLQNEGAMVIVIGMRGGVIDDPYKEHFQDITSRYHAYYIPDVLLTIMGQQNAMFDAVHPNDTGYALLANKVYENIKGIFKKA